MKGAFFFFLGCPVELEHLKNALVLDLGCPLVCDLVTFKGQAEGQGQGENFKLLKMKRSHFDSIDIDLVSKLQIQILYCLLQLSYRAEITKVCIGIGSMVLLGLTFSV